MSPLEWRAILSITSLYAMRMLGLFMILPVFMLSAEHYHDYTPLLAGLAMGIYGLTQASFQIPLGHLSDRWGRKEVIIGGLLVFALGSIVAATADTIWMVILGRALQGAGAIASSLMALATDLTRETYRTRAMAIIGMGIGCSFMLALIIGPILNGYWGIAGIFWLTTLLAILGVLVVVFIVPTPISQCLQGERRKFARDFREVLKSTELLRLNLGVLVLHMTMTALFVVIPRVLKDLLGGNTADHAWVYMLVLLASFCLMVPFIIVAEKKRKMRGVFMGAISVLILAQLSLWLLMGRLDTLIVSLVLYFSAFNLLEASLPSLVSKWAPAAQKGTAMGVFSSAQFLGAFLGGLVGGALVSYYTPQAVWIFCITAVVVWWLVAFNMGSPRYLMNMQVSLRTTDELDAFAVTQALLKVVGIAEAVIIAEEKVAYLKVDRQQLDREALDQVIARYSVS